MIYTYKQIAEKAYANDNPTKLKKVIAAGIAMDNRLKKGYFDAITYLKFFDFESMGIERCCLLYNICPKNFTKIVA